MIKQLIKNIIGSNYSVFSYPIVINSYGRSGSTVLTQGVIRSAVSTQKDPLNKIASGSISKTAWNLEGVNLEGGFVYKTHDYPPSEIINKDIRMLYTFADPSDVVLSLLRLYEQNGEAWMKEHYEHLQAPYSNFNEIINKDQLSLEAHLDSWLNEERFPIAFIRYESMWNHQDDISRFLGFKVQLPPFQERKAVNSQKDKEILRKIRDTYSPLQEKIDNLDDFFVINE